MQITFNDINQLDALLNKYKRVEFVFEFTPFSRDENLLWQAKIKGNYFACGCNTGRMFLMWGFLITAIGLLSNYLYPWINLTVVDYVYLALFVIVLSGIGKAVGKQIAYKSLKDDINELKAKLK